MKVLMMMKWDGGTLEQYEQIRELVDWESNKPKGAVFHVATHDGNALRVTDIWESAEDFNNFVQERLMPATMQAGVPGQPQVEIYPVHSLYVPDAGNLTI